MDPIQNPFSPGAGYPPPALVGREAVLSQGNNSTILPQTISNLATISSIFAGKNELSTGSKAKMRQCQNYCCQGLMFLRNLSARYLA